MCPKRHKSAKKTKVPKTPSKVQTSGLPAHFQNELVSQDFVNSFSTFPKHTQVSTSPPLAHSPPHRAPGSKRHKGAENGEKNQSTHKMQMSGLAAHFQNKVCKLLGNVPISKNKCCRHVRKFTHVFSLQKGIVRDHMIGGCKPRWPQPPHPLCVTSYSGVR